MVAVVLNLFDTFREANFDGNAVNFETPGDNGIKCSLITNSYTPDQNLDEFWDDGPEANEVTGTNYTLDGNLLDNGAVTMDVSGNVKVDLDDPAVWAESGSGFSNARLVVVWLDTGVSGTSRLIAYSADFAGDEGNDTGDFTVTLSSSGLITQAR